MSLTLPERAGARTPLTRPPQGAPQPETPSPEPAFQVERVGADCYLVLHAERPVGFVDVVGHIFVALAGTRYDHATEVGQALDLQAAVVIIAARIRTGTDVGRMP